MLLNKLIVVILLKRLELFSSSFFYLVGLQLNKGVTRVDLLQFASDLDAQADQLVGSVFLLIKPACKSAVLHMSRQSCSGNLSKRRLFIPPVQHPSHDVGPWTGCISRLNAALMSTAGFELLFLRAQT